MDRKEAMRSVRPAPFWQEIIPRVVEAYLLRTVRVETADTEANIPPGDPLVSLFAPHCGWIESMIVDDYFRRVRGHWPFWLTKKENETLPRILVGNRTICVDRECPEPSMVRRIFEILRQPDGVVATAIEGTRSGDPRDPEDLLVLGEFKSGLVRIAIQAQVPILPVVLLGTDQVSPMLDLIWEDRGTFGAFREIERLRAHPQPIEARFLPPYQDHLEGDGGCRGSRLRAKALLHTSRLEELFVAQILDLCPDYPLGALQHLVKKH